MNSGVDNGSAVVARWAVTVARLDDFAADGGAASTRRELERRAAGALLRRMLGAGAAIGHRPDGSPFVEGRDDLFISLSHSRRRLAIVVGADAPAGIDIEEPSPRLARVVPRVLNAAEPAGIDPLKAWTAKEAVFKCAGIGGLVLSDISLDAEAAVATVPDGSVFRVLHLDRGLALAVRLPRE